MLSAGLTARLDDIATRVAARAHGAVWMLDTALVADASARHWALDDQGGPDAEDAR